jgi:hypothetical protein
MGAIETIRFAIRGVTANKLRSGLTVLGILIGVAAVILLVAVGNGSAKAVQASIERLGTNTLTVTGGGVRNGGGVQIQNTSLTSDLVGALSDKGAAPDVKSVSPVVTGSQTATFDGVDQSIGQFVGTVPAYLPASNTAVARGASFTSDDVKEGRRVVVLGTTAATGLFAGADPIGQQITITGTLFTVVGVLADKGGAGFNDPNDIAIAPVTAVQEALTGYGPLNQLLVQATGPDSVDAAQAEVTAILNRAARRGRGDQPAGRRHRHHQHHDGDRHRADPRDRHPQGPRRPETYRPHPVPGGGHGTECHRGSDRRPGRGHRQPVHHRRHQAGDRSQLGRAGAGRLGRDRALLRQLSGQSRGRAAAHRGTPL